MCIGVCVHILLYMCVCTYVYNLSFIWVFFFRFWEELIELLYSSFVCGICSAIGYSFGVKKEERREDREKEKEPMFSSAYKITIGGQKKPALTKVRSLFQKKKKVLWWIYLILFYSLTFCPQTIWFSFIVVDKKMNNDRTTDCVSRWACFGLGCL